MATLLNSGPEAHALDVFERHGGILSTSQALRLGVHPRTLYTLRDSAILERVERGLYRLANSKPIANPDLVIAARKVPRGVVCLISALALHQMTTQIPHAVYLAIPANDQAPVLKFPPLKLFWYSEAVYEAGIETSEVDATPLRVYSPEKTLADCFKYRNKIGIEVCVEALNAYRKRGQMNLKLIEQYARLCRVERVMRPYLEAAL